ncbi:MAG: hypothetical protein ABGY75_20575 [Gemmataceae bacterium]
MMAELFGDRSDFAIEAGVEPELKPPSAVWGHMCVWCRGVALGDLNDPHCGLAHAYSSFQQFPGQLDRLWAPELEGLDDIATWNFFDGLLYGYHVDVEVPDDRTAGECSADWMRWGAHDFLTNWGEQFDGCKAFVTCPPGDMLRIYFRRRSDPVRCVEVTRAGFTAASTQFVKWFEQQEQRLRGPDS